MSSEKISPETFEFMARHEALFSKHFRDGLDEQTLILKAHLLLEELLRDFCIRSVPYPNHLRKARLSFNQTVQLARSLCILSDFVSDWAWSVIEHLNKMRNLLAHELEPDQAKFEECRQKIITAVKNSSNVDYSDSRLNLNELQGSLCYTVGAMSAVLEFGIAMNTDEFKALGDDT
ncbi:hypothetical protein [Pseudomonas jessenii]|uniref:hypothetical protein n=1 Tax=Pseudomonas jessenii TaxID=77298 RepID=UPI0030BA6AE6